MGTDEREAGKHPRADGEPDVEAHQHFHKARDEEQPNPEDRDDDDKPDVEAHQHFHK
ncbi:MAG: hypothetical protein ACTHNU_04335 [Gaiellales bacterium]